MNRAFHQHVLSAVCIHNMLWCFYKFIIRMFLFFLACLLAAVRAALLRKKNSAELFLFIHIHKIAYVYTTQLSRKFIYPNGQMMLDFTGWTFSWVLRGMKFRSIIAKAILYSDAYRYKSPYLCFIFAFTELAFLFTATVASSMQRDSAKNSKNYAYKKSRSKKAAASAN